MKNVIKAIYKNVKVMGTFETRNFCRGLYVFMASQSTINCSKRHNWQQQDGSKKALKEIQWRKCENICYFNVLKLSKSFKMQTSTAE